MPTKSGFYFKRQFSYLIANDMFTSLIGRLFVFSLLVSLTSCDYKKLESSGNFKAAAKKEDPSDIDPFEEEFQESIEMIETDDAPPERLLEGRSDSPGSESGKESSSKDQTTTTLSMIIPLSPLSVLDQYVLALKEDRLSDAARLFVLPKEKEFRAKLRKELKKLSRLAVAGELTMIPLSQRLSSSWALVVVRIEMTKEGKRRIGIQDQYLVKTEEGWHLAPPWLHKDPELDPLLTDRYRRLAKWYRKNYADLKDEYLFKHADE